MWKVIFFIHFCGEERDGFHKGIQCFPISPQYDYISVDRYIWRCNFAKYQSVEIIAYVGPFYGVFKASRKRFTFWICKKGVSFRNYYIYTQPAKHRCGKTRGRRRRSLMYSRYPLYIRIQYICYCRQATLENNMKISTNEFHFFNKTGGNKRTKNEFSNTE